MSKTLFVLVLACLSNFAFADYFGCELKTGNARIDVEAEYRGREVSISHEDWTCSGVIDGNMIVHVTLKSDVLNTTTSSSDRGSAVVGFADAVCSCGLR